MNAPLNPRKASEVKRPPSSDRKELRNRRALLRPPWRPLSTPSFSRQEVRNRLSALEYYVTQEAGTERPFTGRYWNCKDEGVYTCVVCGASLFSSDTKYDSGTGWPSFYEEIAEGCVERRPDHSGGRVRTEVVCCICSAHLGHVFDDGPQPTGERYCINSASLRLADNA